MLEASKIISVKLHAFSSAEQARRDGALFVAQSNNGVDARRSARGHKTGYRGYDEKDARDDHDCRNVIRPEAV